MCRFALCSTIRQADSRGLTQKWEHTFFMYNGLTDLNLLYDSYIASMKGSSWKEEPQRFEADFLSEIVKLQKELIERTYKTLPGVEFTLNERGKIRHIHGSRMRDRVVRHALCDGELNDVLRPYLIYNNGASQKGKGITFTRKLFERDLHNFWLKYRSNDGYVGFVDLSKFYDNIQHDKVREMVLPKLSDDGKWLFNEILKHMEVDVSYMTDEQYAHCMDTKFDSLWYYNNVPFAMRTGEKMMAKGLDIGDQVSQSIGVYFPTPIDNYVKIVRGCKWYGRYMDDMYIICKDRTELKSIIAGITEAAEKLGMFVNPKKTRIVKLSGQYKFLQVKYSLDEKGKVVKRINPKSVTRERRRMKAYKRLFDAESMPYIDIENACRSWMGDFARLMSKMQIGHMKDLYFSLFGRELIWKRKLYLQMERKSMQKRTALA